MSFIAEVSLVIRHVIKHPQLLINAILNEPISSWHQLHLWRPLNLHSGTLIKLNILLSSPETRCMLWLNNIRIYPDPLQQSINAHLSASTWKTYRCCITRFIRWHWSQFPLLPSIPASAASVRTFIALGCHPSFLPALTKVHNILQLPLQFSNPLTTIINHGARRRKLNSKRDKAFLSRRLLYTVSTIACSKRLLLFQALLVLAYCFSLRTPSELLDPTNYYITVDDDLCHFHLRHRKNSSQPCHLTRRCTCTTWGRMLCPVRAASLVAQLNQPISLSAFNRHLKTCLHDAGVANWKSFSSHSLRRGHTQDLFDAGAPNALIDFSGGWHNPLSKFHYISLQKHQ